MSISNIYAKKIKFFKNDAQTSTKLTYGPHKKSREIVQAPGLDNAGRRHAGQSSCAFISYALKGHTLTGTHQQSW